MKNKNIFSTLTSSYFKKIFLYSTSLITITILISYILNIFLLNSFYLYRKKVQIKEAIQTIEKIYLIEKTLEEFNEQLKETQGIEFKILSPENYKAELERSDMSSHGEYGKMMARKQRFIPRYVNLSNENFSINKHAQFGIKILSFTNTLPNGDKLVLWSSLTVIDSHRREFAIFNIIATFISVTITIIFSCFFAKKITKDINKLTLIAEKISNLQFPNDIIINRNDEIGDLSISLDKMSKKLESSLTNLKLFVSNASHELKTPISVLNLYTQSLFSKKVTTAVQIKDYQNVISKTLGEMQTLVENLLTLSKISSLNYEIAHSKVSLDSIIHSSIEKYEMLELKNDIEFNMNFPTITLNGDPILLKIALENIIQNALKYSPPSSIIDISYIDNKLIFKNENDNVSFSELQNLFEPFFRCSNSNNITTEGTGLGLSIVKQIFELHNMKYGIELQDKYFIFWLEVLDI